MEYSLVYFFGKLFKKSIQTNYGGKGSEKVKWYSTNTRGERRFLGSSLEELTNKCLRTLGKY